MRDFRIFVIEVKVKSNYWIVGPAGALKFWYCESSFIFKEQMEISV